MSSPKGSPSFSPSRNFLFGSFNVNGVVRIEGDANFIGDFFVTGTSYIATSSLSTTKVSYETKTGNYTINTSNLLILADASSNNITITLPTAVDNSGIFFGIKRIDNGSGNKTVTVTSSVNIDNQSSGIGLDAHASIFVLSNNSKWWIV